MKKELEIRCMCRVVSGAFKRFVDGALMHLDTSQDIYFCPACGNHLSHEVIEDIVEPLLKQGKKQSECVLLPALKYQILITGVKRNGRRSVRGEQ